MTANLSPDLASFSLSLFGHEHSLGRFLLALDVHHCLKPAADMSIDSYRFLDFASRQVMAIDDSRSDSSRRRARLAGISYPMGRPLGQPHDADGQRAVLRSLIGLLSTARGPDSYVELPFVWPEPPARARNASADLPPPPIVDLVTKKPWLLVNLYTGRIPHGNLPPRMWPRRTRDEIATEHTDHTD